MMQELDAPLILIVEDDRVCRDVTARFLALYGYRVVTAADGAEGVAQTIALMPQLVLMDIGLPILNGWGATTQIRATPAVSQVPIIALTAFVMQDERERCFAAGCNDVIAKPVIFTELLARIKQLLNTPLQRVAH